MTKGRCSELSLLLIITGVFVCAAFGGCSGPPARSTPKNPAASPNGGAPCVTCAFLQRLQTLLPEFPRLLLRSGRCRMSSSPTAGGGDSRGLLLRAC